MPWKETTPVAERMQFLVDYRSGLFTVSFLAERHGVSRRTLYKWIERFEMEGVAGLEDQMRRPRWHPNQTSEEVEAAIAEFRRKHPDWGPKKIVHVLSGRDEETSWPARSTVAAILKRHGLVKGRRRRRPVGHPGRPTTVAREANELWATDFKGEFRTGDGIYCYPLTVTDLYSRYLVGCKGLLSTKTDGVKIGLRAAVSGIRTATSHPKRQRSSVRFDGTRAALALVGVVDQARDQARADAAGPSRAERLARENASHTQAGDDPACGPRPPRSAATLRCLSAGVQYRAAPRKHRHETAGGSLPAFTARVSLRSTAHGVPRPLRGQARQSKRRNPLEEGLAQRQPSADRRVRRARGGRRRDLESPFWSAAAGTLRRARRKALRGFLCTPALASRRPRRARR